MRYKFIAYFPRGMDEIYFTEKVAARIFFFTQPVEIVPWKRTILHESLECKISFLSQKSTILFFFFPRTTGCQSTSYLLQFLLRNSILDRDLRSGPESAVMVIGMNGQIFSFPSFFFFSRLIKFPSNESKE